MKNKALQKIIKHLVISLLLIISYLYTKNIKYSYINISNALAILGLVYMIIGLYRIVRKLHFFDLAFFGVKKIIELIFTHKYSKSTSKVGEYNNYLLNNQYNKSIIEFIVIGMFLLSFSIYFALK